MAATLPSNFRGTTITFSSGFMAQILGLSLDGFERQMINKSHSGTTTAHEYMVAALHEPGSLSVELSFDARSAAAPPIDNDFETVVITFGPSGSQSTYTYTRSAGLGGGALSGFTVTGVAADSDDKMTATATLKLSGNVVVADV